MNPVNSLETLQVKLVGFEFSSSSGHQVYLSAEFLNDHLQSLVLDLHAVVLQPELKHLVRGGVPGAGPACGGSGLRMDWE